MAVLEVFQPLSGRSGSLDVSRNRTYSLAYRVATDDPETGPAEVRNAVLNALGVSPEGYYAMSSGETDDTAYVTGVDVDQVADDPTFWEARVSFGPLNIEPGSIPGTPIEAPPDLSWDFEPYEVAVERDVITNNAIVNAAGDPFDPGVTATRRLVVLRVARNEAAYDALLAFACADKTNLYAWKGGDPGTWLATPPAGRRAFSPEIGIFWIVNYEFTYNPDGWKKRLLNIGLRAKVGTGSSATRKHINDSKGVAISSPVPLTSAGAAQYPGGPVTYLDYSVYGSIDYGIFGLD